MKRELAISVVGKIRWEIRKQEMFLMRVQRIQALPDASKDESYKRLLLGGRNTWRASTICPTKKGEADKSLRAYNEEAY